MIGPAPHNYHRVPKIKSGNKDEAKVLSNIMKILAMRGNYWRLLTWDEYAWVREKHTKDNPAEYDSVKERDLFYRVVLNTATPQSANAVDPNWFLDTE